MRCCIHHGSPAMPVRDSAQAHTTAGRGGSFRSDDGIHDHALVLPGGPGGPGGTCMNPERLFACGDAACFGGALKLVAGLQKIATGPVTISADESIGKDATGHCLAIEPTGHLPESSGKLALA